MKKRLTYREKKRKSNIIIFILIIGIIVGVFLIISDMFPNFSLGNLIRDIL
jgi:hypothetical protein